MLSRFARDASIFIQNLGRRDTSGWTEAIKRTQGVIEFDLDGTIIAANDKYLAYMGYDLSEIAGKHHRIFVEMAEKHSSSYIQFWQRLAAGEYDSGRYRRLAKDGQPVWVQASYNPIFNRRGQVYKIVKFATDVTEQIRSQEFLLRAIADTSSAVEASNRNDLSKRIAVDKMPTEISCLCIGINNLLDATTDSMRHISSIASDLNATSSSVASESIELAARTKYQSEKLHEGFYSIFDISDKLNIVAKKAETAISLAETTKTEVMSTIDIMNRAVTFLSSARKTSEKISSKVDLIDTVLEHANLLALNAKIEAARSGAAGRGFAVVSDEMRELAVNMALLSKDIKEFVRLGLDGVVSAVQATNAANLALAKCSEDAENTVREIKEIAVASNEQARYLGEISRLIAHVDEITQKNANLVERGMEASCLLERKARLMQQNFEKFAFPPTRDRRH